MKLIECVPNFSEGRDVATIETIRDSIAAVADVTVLHVTSDAWHNRSVITFVAPADTIVEAAIAAIRAARDNIDLSRHEGVHPRIGAADVVPFIPLDGATMEDCIAIAREVGRRVGQELDIPVYLYERAALRATRTNLADIRRGGFETLQNVIGSDPARAPDFGPARVHPTAGAVAIGARPFLIAFNAYIGPESNLSIAKTIARTIRESGGGLPGVKALGLSVDGQAQVSMNLVDIERTSLAAAYTAVEHEARAHGVAITWSEIIGLVPERAVAEVASNALGLHDDIASHMLESVLLAKVPQQSLSGFIDSVASATAVPGGGSVAAIAAALAAALTRMVAGLTMDRPDYSTVASKMRTSRDHAGLLIDKLMSLAKRDAEAYSLVIDTRRRCVDSSSSMAPRETAMQDSLLVAAQIPLDVCRAAEEVVRLCEVVATCGNVNAITDSGTAAMLASTACAAAAYNVRVNVRALPEPADGVPLAVEATALTRSSAEISARVAILVEAAL